MIKNPDFFEYKIMATSDFISSYWFYAICISLISESLSEYGLGITSFGAKLRKID